MKLNEGRPGAAELIRKYEPGSVTIGTQQFALPVLVVVGEGGGPLEGTSLEALTETDVARVLALRPTIVLAGSAAGRAQPPQALRHTFESRRIALEAMDLGAACRTYNVLIQEDREVLALLFP